MSFLKKLLGLNNSETVSNSPIFSRETPKSCFELPLSQWSKEDFRQHYKNYGKYIDWPLFERTSNSPLFFYPLATEAEEREVYGLGRSPAVKGHICYLAVGNLLYYYSSGVDDEGGGADYSIYKDPYKVEFWKTRVITEAEKGNRYAQALLVTRRGAFCGKGRWQSDSEFEHNTAKYLPSLLDDAANEEPAALAAVALFYLDDSVEWGSQDRYAYFEKAAVNGVPDAYYWLAQSYRDLYQKKTGNSINYSDPENGEYYKLLEKAAETDTGAHIMLVQGLVGDAYKDGDIIGFTKDMSKANYWLTKAAQKGSETSARTLEFINGRG